MRGTGLEYAIGIIAIVVVVIVGGIFLLIGAYENRVQASQSDVAFNAVESAYLIKSCLQQDGQITKAYLESNKGKHLCELCGICSVIVEASVTDMETGDVWSFEYGTLTQAWEWLKDMLQVWKDSSEKRAKHSILINIQDGDEVHIGGLDVKA